MQTIDNKTSSAFPLKLPTWRQRAGRRTATAMSAVAAVLVIALVVTALIASHLPGKTSATQPINQTWSVLPHLTNIASSDLTLLAPSDPRVVYQVANPNHPLLVSLRRSDDQGATWKNLPGPDGTQESLRDYYFLYISPTNAQHVLYLARIVCPSGQASVAGPLSILSGEAPCLGLYFSNNGGESWAPATLSAHGSHTLFLYAGFSAQENRLYAIASVNPGLLSSELVMSSDDGATWQFADQGLIPQHHCLWNIAVPTTGTTLFAETASNCDTTPSDSVQIWRSDNAGARWSAVSSISLSFAGGGLMAVNVSGQGQPVLFNRGEGPAWMFSLDNGKTWQLIPALDDQGSEMEGRILGILHDGSILEESKTGFYAWKAGDASWHKVAPALAGVVSSSLVVSDPVNGKETLYLEVSLSVPIYSYSYYSIDLA